MNEDDSIKCKTMRYSKSDAKRELYNNFLSRNKKGIK